MIWIAIGTCMVYVALFYSPTIKSVYSPKLHIRGRECFAKFRLYRRMFRPQWRAQYDPGGAVYTILCGPCRLIVVVSAGKSVTGA